MQNPFGASIPSPFAARQSLVSRARGSIGEAFWADMTPSYAWGQVTVTSGGFGSVASLSGSNTTRYVASIGQTGGGSASNTGTCTFTFNNSTRGEYLLTAEAQMIGGAAYTGAVTLRHTFGGSVNFFTNNTQDTISVPTPANDQTITSFRLIQNTGAQTVTINTIGAASNAGALTFYVQYCIMPISWTL